MKIALLVLAIVQGSFMTFDGVHELITGSYFGGRVGPWGHLAKAMRIRPESIAPAFIIIGSWWLIAAISLYSAPRRSKVLLLVPAVITLGYPLFGTVLSVITLGLLFIRARGLNGSLRDSRVHHE